ncbi:MAG: hypothetical protein GW906_00485 [Epsilonproteobacteria bacterium]|nr:hypothetical protein [Campylobacterota bacterium]NCO25326.1 hypothetical protein [Campylobacterota bacterium]NCO30976.1 hypothetical protein [Campylobacterota bacterium]NCS68275.1 hypothetical protein [Campylobacterota bacterium]
MCFVASIILVVLGINFYNAGNIPLALGSFLFAALFIGLMVRNILYVKKMKREKKDDN